MITFQDGIVSVTSGGVTVCTPRRLSTLQGRRLYSALAALPTPQAALIRLARLVVYQVCND